MSKQPNQREDHVESSQQLDTERSGDVIEAQKSTDDIKQIQPQKEERQYQNDRPQERLQDAEGGTDVVKISIEEETIKVSSDEGFDTQSSLDLSKHSHESYNTNVEDRSKLKKEVCYKSANNKPDRTTTEANNDEKSQPCQEAKSAGPWGSAASKSWASLFRADGSTHHGPTTIGDTDHDNLVTDPENPEKDSKGNPKPASKQEVNGKIYNNFASTKEQRSQDAARRAQDKMASKLAQKINSISLKHSLPLLRPRGFINKGNGCYINSTLQALIACPPFYNLMKEIGELRGLKRESSCTPILDSFSELFQNFPPLDASKKNKQGVPSEQKSLMNYLQADALEPRCIYNVLGQIKSECLRGKLQIKSMIMHAEWMV